MHEEYCVEMLYKFIKSVLFIYECKQLTFYIIFIKIKIIWNTNIISRYLVKTLILQAYLHEINLPVIDLEHRFPFHGYIPRCVAYLV